MSVRASTCQARGFSLIELMVVVAIVGILSAIAVPQYQEYVTRSRLADAHATLANGRVRAEQYYQDNRTYVDMPCPGISANFSYECDTTGTTYTITATGIASGTVGFEMSINQNNVQATPNAPPGWETSTSCWVTRKGGC